MIEPTETETIEDLDRHIEALKEIAQEAEEEPDKVLTAPHNTAISRLDRWKPQENPYSAGGCIENVLLRDSFSYLTC